MGNLTRAQSSMVAVGAGILEDPAAVQVAFDIATKTELASSAAGKGAELVEYRGATVEAALDERLPEIGNYALLRSYTGTLTAFMVRGVATDLDGGAGVFRVKPGDTTTDDDGGTVLVDAVGRRWHRDTWGFVLCDWFDQKANGTADDTLAVSKAIIACSRLGGGDVWLKAGTSIITKRAADGQPAGTKYYFLPMRSNVRLRGRGMDVSVLKIADNTGNYHRVFRTDNPVWSTRVDNFGYSDFTIDANASGTGNGITNTLGFADNARVEFDLRYGKNATFERVKIKDSSSGNSILAYYLWEGGLTVKHCKFVDMGDCANHVVHDMSTILVQAGDYTIFDNEFRGKTRDKAAYTAIELDYGRGTVFGNRIYDYHYGVLIASVVAPVGQEMLVANNYMDGVRAAFYLWSFPPNTGSHASSVGLSGIHIHDNVCKIANLSYSKQDEDGNYYRQTAGLLFQTASSYDIENVNVHDNTFVFEIETATSQDNQQTMGMGWDFSLVTANKIPLIKNSNFSRNKIVNSPGPAMNMVNASLFNVAVEDNEWINPMHSPATVFNGATAYYPLNYYIPTNGSAVGSAQDVRINRNRVIDTFATSKVKAFAKLNQVGGLISKGVELVGNTVRATGATTTSLVDYIILPSDTIRPLVKGEFDGFLSDMGANIRYFAAGSEVLDKANSRVWRHAGTGLNWGTYHDFGTTAPTTLYWTRGSRRVNHQPNPGQPSYWECIGSGTPGIWLPMDVTPGVTMVGDEDASITAGSSSPTYRWTSVLTVARTATLVASGAWIGAKFRIFRAASATGAFNLNINNDVNGTIKQLTAAGQWCDVEFNGTNWMVTASGTL